VTSKTEFASYERMETPKEWPQEIAESYDPIRVLGTGGFASVVLSRQRNQQSLSCDGNSSNAITPSGASTNSPIPNKVAIKVVGCNDGTGAYDKAVLYARREIELLQQIRHSGIVRLFHSWERRDHTTKEDQQRDDDEEIATTTHRPAGLSPTAGVLVLEYLKGPTVESLLKHGGALSTTFGRVVIAQVMDAVAYLHYRAVVHRDIKPDNIMVTGALSSDDSIWDNDDDENDANHTGCDAKSSEYWKQQCLKYKATIIDFGFARALTPEDVEDPMTAESRCQSQKASYYDVVQDDHATKARKKKTFGSGVGTSMRGIFGSTDSLKGLDDSMRSNTSVYSNTSVSHRMIRVMSTLGNKNYAAPEIIDKVRILTSQDKKKDKRNVNRSNSTKTISNFVADYGLLADSYSMGHTIRYMMTGVRPGLSATDTVRKQQRSGMAQKVLSKLGLTKKKKKPSSSSATTTNHALPAKKKLPRKPHYRSLGDLPGQVFLLIEDLKQQSVNKRISIRKARRTVSWISDVLAFQETPTNYQNNKQYYDELSSEEFKTITTTTTTENSKQHHHHQTSMEHVSEEQLHSLDKTRYLPLAAITHSNPNPLDYSSEDENEVDILDGLEDGIITF